MYCRSRTVETTTYSCEHEGETETKVEQKVTIQSDGEPIDHDEALAQAIQEATAMNPDMTVEKIEIHQTTQNNAAAPEVDGFDQFVADYGLSGTATDDADSDSLSDRAEYLFGGNPTKMPQMTDRWICCFLGMRCLCGVGAWHLRGAKPTGHPSACTWLMTHSGECGLQWDQG